MSTMTTLPDTSGLLWTGDHEIPSAGDWVIAQVGQPSKGLARSVCAMVTGYVIHNGELGVVTPHGDHRGCELTPPAVRY